MGLIAAAIFYWLDTIVQVITCAGHKNTQGWPIDGRLKNILVDPQCMNLTGLSGTLYANGCLLNKPKDAWHAAIDTENHCMCLVPVNYAIFF